MQLFCICGQNLLKVPFKSLQHATLLKNVHRHKYFLRIATPQEENSFVVQYAQHQWLLLEFIYLFTTLFNVGHTILTRLIKTNLTKNHNRNLGHAKQEQ